MKCLFLDSEFTSLSQSAELISLAFVTDCGKTFYAEFNDWHIDKCTKFVKEHVLHQLGAVKNDTNISNYRIIGDREEITNALRKWLAQFEKVQIWGDVPHYDWVLFCELFGGSFFLPQNLDYMVMDLATLLQDKGFDKHQSRIEFLDSNEIPKGYQQHHALYDAEVDMRILQKLKHSNVGN